MAMTYADAQEILRETAHIEHDDDYPVPGCSLCQEQFMDDKKAMIQREVVND